MKWDELYKYKNLNIFSFINKRLIQNHIKNCNILKVIKDPNSFKNSLYLKFLTEAETWFDSNELQIIKGQLIGFAKKEIWSQLLKNNNIFIGDSETSLFERAYSLFDPDLMFLGGTLPRLSDFSLTPQSDKSKWLQERAGFITGSCIDDLLPTNKTFINRAKENSVTKCKYLIKLARERKNGFAMEDEASFKATSALRGILREDFTRAKYEEEQNILIFEVGFFRSPEHVGLGCSLDGLILGVDEHIGVYVKSAVEIKNFTDHLKLYEMFAENNFDTIKKQVQYNMLLTNCGKMTQLIDTGIDLIAKEQSIDLTYISNELLPLIVHNTSQIKHIGGLINNIKGL